MIEWTEAAKRILDEYCARSRATLAATGADADEVSDDLRRHVEEEARAAQLSVVTEEDVRRILARIGEPESAREAVAGKRPTATGPSGPQPREKTRPGFVLLALGVFFPLGTLAFELVTGISAGVLFDPLPSWLNVLAIALVPAANFWMWRAGRARDSRHARLLGWLNGAALGVCIYYSLMYLFFVPIALLGIIYFGLGLIPLTPYLALIATPILRAAYRQRIGKERLPGMLGALAGFGFLILLQMPAALTYYGLAQAVSEDPDVRLRGVRVLRNFGDDDLILRACYGLLRNELGFDLVRGLAAGNQGVTGDQAREIYYRVTGKPFNSVPPPALYTRMGRWDALDQEYTWDDALGGEVVAGRLKGLSLASSRMDAVADPAGALVYCEWTLEFKNVSPQPREARAQIALPPGAVVSRLTLWVNGEEREAAFGGRSQVREAYRDVAIVQRRDPVLVTTCGPDRVLVQCFPVPPTGGTMKVRLGITAPLVLESLDDGRFVWPFFLERNFGIPPDFKHACWIDSMAPLTDSKGFTVTNSGPARPFALHLALPESELSESARTVEVHRSADVNSACQADDDGGKLIRQTIETAPISPPPRLVLVLDGSAGMRTFLPKITEALAQAPAAAEISVIIAGDKPVAISERPRTATPAVLDDLRQRLRRVQFAGGQDNLPALEDAWDLAASVENGTVIWIHPPQSVLLSSESGLVQRLERTRGTTRLFELQTRTGPDRVVEKLDGFASVGHVPRFGALGSDLGRLFSELSGKSRHFELVRERIPASPEADGWPHASGHLLRLWARDEAIRLAAHGDREAAVKVAAGHQLVTPLSGAVVLETQQQFTRNGLKPADPATVPSVPEPQTWVLMGVGMMLAILCRRIKRAHKTKHGEAK